jgi:hypothetical protein
MISVGISRDVKSGEKLTLDYAQFCDHNMEPVECRYGSSNCKKLISGPEANSLNLRERGLRKL